MRSVKWLTVEKWLERSKPFQIAHQFNLRKKTVANIVDRFVHTSSPYTEFCKQQRPSMYTTEIQKQLIENQVIDSQRFDKFCIDTRFGLLIQKVDNSSKRELDNFLTESAQEKLEEYLDVCSNCDPRNRHFFEKSSVIKTTGKRSYCRANLWSSVVPKLTTTFHGFTLCFHYGFLKFRPVVVTW